MSVVTTVRGLEGRLIAWLAAPEARRVGSIRRCKYMVSESSTLVCQSIKTVVVEMLAG
jgi:hypothetical protein